MQKVVATRKEESKGNLLKIALELKQKKLEIVSSILNAYRYVHTCADYGTNYEQKFERLSYIDVCVKEVW